MNSMMLIVQPILRPESESQNGLAMALDARASGASDDRGMHRAGGKDHAISRLELELAAVVLEDERDRSIDAVKDFLVAVRVRGVAIARSVRPRVAALRFAAQLGHELVEGRHRAILRWAN